jgi:hypothetical protein
MARAQTTESDKRKALFELEEAKSEIAYMKKQALVDISVRDRLQKKLEDVKKELSLERNCHISTE